MRIVLLLPLAAACVTLSHGTGETGAASPHAAIEQFLAAARRHDLPAVSAVWGTPKGPASRTMRPRDLERRVLIMIQCLAHEQATLGDGAPIEGGRLRVAVALTAHHATAQPLFTVVPGPADRWYVENVDLDHLRDRGFCAGLAAPISIRTVR